MIAHTAPGSHPDLTAAILAGGRARRFGGRDKSALRVGGLRILDRQIAALAPVTPRLVIVANEPERYRSLGVPIVTDLLEGAGTLGGLYTAVVSAPTTQTLVVACDMPFLTTAFLEHLAGAGREADVAIPRSRDGYQPLCASYRRAAADAMRRRIDRGDLKVTGFLAEVRVREIGPEDLAPFDPDGRLFLNVNTPGEYARALRLVNP